MKPDEQLGERVEQLLAQVGEAAAAEQGPVGQRVLEVLRDQHRVEIVRPPDHDTDRLDHRHRLGAQRDQELVLALRIRLGQLLERVQGLIHLDETNDVPPDPADHAEPLGPPARVGLARCGRPGQCRGHRDPRRAGPFEVLEVAG